MVESATVHHDGVAEDYATDSGMESADNKELAAEWSKDDVGSPVLYDSSIVQNLDGQTRVERRPLIFEEQMSCFKNEQ
eukprot:scaffold198052_cov71-Attheya_sp.AAC.1